MFQGTGPRYWNAHMVLGCGPKGSVARGFESRFTNCSSDSETSGVEGKKKVAKKSKDKPSAACSAYGTAEEVRAKSVIRGLLAFDARHRVAQQQKAARQQKAEKLHMEEEDFLNHLVVVVFLDLELVLELRDLDRQRADLSANLYQEEADIYNG